MSHSAKPDFLEGVQRFHSEGNCWCRLPSLLREHLLGLPSGDNPRSPVHPRSFAMVASQYGRIGTLSNQFGELLVAAGVPDAARYGAEWAMKAPRSAIAILTSAKKPSPAQRRRFPQSENQAPVLVKVYIVILHDDAPRDVHRETHRGATNRRAAAGRTSGQRARRLRGSPLRSRREYRRACQRSGKSGKEIERCVISTFQVAESIRFKGDFRQWEHLLRVGD